MYVCEGIILTMLINELTLFLLIIIDCFIQCTSTMVTTWSTSTQTLSPTYTSRTKCTMLINELTLFLLIIIDCFIQCTSTMVTTWSTSTQTLSAN